MKWRRLNTNYRQTHGHVKIVNADGQLDGKTARLARSLKQWLHSTQSHSGEIGVSYEKHTLHDRCGHF